MALINCYECEKEISDQATACPHCGFPVILNKKIIKNATIDKSDKYVPILADIVGISMFLYFSLRHDNETVVPEVAAVADAQQELLVPEMTGRELLWAQFSKSDGSHAALIAKIKNSMNNPDSFEHVETIYYWTDETKQSTGDKITVKMTYRGTNGFGGVVTETVMAQVDTYGNVLEVVGQ